MVVFGAPPVERSKQTGVSASTIYRKVSRFDELGMQSLFEAEPVEDKRQLPAHGAIVQFPMGELQDVGLYAGVVSEASAKRL